MSTDTPPLVRMKGVSKAFVTQRMTTQALADISMSVYRGEYLRIEGRSGCGKTTLLSIIGLLDEPTAGTYELDGVDVERVSLAQRAGLRNRLLGFVFQSFNLIDEMTVVENVEMPLRYRGVPAAERRERAMACLDRVGIAPRWAHYPPQLSGGQQQRAAIARALVGSPALLLADEPTGNLDPETGRGVMELLSESHRAGGTVCVVSHDRDYDSLADRTIRLDEGRIEEME